MRLAAAVVVVGVVSIAACAPRVPTASVEEHRRLAQAAEELGIAHEALYDPRRMDPTIPCMELCFNPWTNPTEVYHREAKEFWRVAKQHLEASRKLRVAEERACLGVPERDRDVGAFVDCSNITAVEWPQREADPFVVELAVSDIRAKEFRARMACHLARNESRGRELPEMSECPLIVRGAQAEVVTIDEDGVRVEMHGGDQRTRAEIRARLTAILASGHGSQPDQQPSQRQ